MPPPKNEGLCYREKGGMDTGQATSNLFHKFRLKKWKNKSIRKKAYLWTLHHPHLEFTLRYKVSVL